MTPTDRIVAYVQAEIDRFKGEGGLVDESEAIGKIAFYMAVLRAGFPDAEAFGRRVDIACEVSQSVLQRIRGNAVMKQVEPS